MSSISDLPSRDDPVRIVVEIPGRHLRAFGVSGDGNDELLAIARINPDGSGWTVSTRGGRTRFPDEIAARMFMLGLLDEEEGSELVRTPGNGPQDPKSRRAITEFDPDAEDDGGDELVIR